MSGNKLSNVNSNSDVGAKTELASVVITDDHSIVRHGLKAVLSASGRYSIVGEADSVEATLELLQKMSPRYLVLDLGLPGRSGLEALYAIKDKDFPTQVIVLSMYEDEDKIRQALAAGAKGYVFKRAALREVVDALDQVQSGAVYLPEGHSNLISTSGVQPSAGAITANSTDPSKDPLYKLSNREREVFFMLAEGLPNRVIAKRLFISPRTVETHRARVIKKMGFDSSAALIRYAIKHNLVALEAKPTSIT